MVGFPEACAVSFFYHIGFFSGSSRVWERSKAGGEVVNKMVEWHHQLNGHEFEQTLGDGEGLGSLACCSPPGHKELDTTERLKTTGPSKKKILCLPLRSF